MIKKKDLVIVVVVAFCLTAALFTIVPVSSSGAWPTEESTLKKSELTKVEVSSICLF